MATPITATQMQKALYESNRDYYNRKTWENLITGTQQSAMAAENQLVKQYTDASTAAYTSYLQNRANIEVSGIYGQSKQNMLSENRINLEEAYNTYKQNLAEQEESVATQYQKSMSNISSALETEAANQAAYENLHYDYMTELFAAHPELYNDPRFAQYITKDPQRDEETHEILRNDEGDILYKDPRVKTIDELYKDMYTLNKETGLYEMNINAVDYYDMIENLYLGDEEHLPSWQNFVSEKNPELAAWAQQEDAYNYTKAGTKAGTFKSITGRESTDFDWSYAERLTGIKVDQIQNQFDSFKDTYSENLKTIDDIADEPTRLKKSVTLAKDTVGELGKMLDTYGMRQAFEEDIGMSLDAFAEQLADSANGIASGGKIAGTVLGSMAGAAGGAALYGLAVGGPVGALVGAVGGLILGGIGGGVAANQMTEQSREIEAAARESFDKLLVATSNYVAAKRAAAPNIDKSKRLY